MTLIIALWNLILAFGAALNVERFGRRPLFFSPLIGILMSYTLVMGLSAGFDAKENHSIGIAVVPFLYPYVIL